MLVKDLILSLVREKIVKMNYQKSYLFCGFFFFVWFGWSFAGDNKQVYNEL